MNVIKKVSSIVLVNNKLKIAISYIISKITKIIYTGPFSFLKFTEKKKIFEINHKEVLIKTLLCGICGSDKKIISFDYSLNSTAFPDTLRQDKKETYLGHELVGKVEAIGDHVKKFKKNDFVILDSINRNNHILKKNEYGGWSNFLVRNENQLFKINNRLKKEKAILIEPLACSLNSVIEANITNKKKNILIIGTGIIGLGVYIFLRYFFKNMSITFLSKDKLSKKILDNDKYIQTINPDKLINETSKILNTKIKKFFTNEITSGGFDYIFECSGDERVLKKIVKICNYNSKIILTGMIMKNTKLDLTPLWLRNIKLISPNGYKLKYNFKKISNTFEFIERLIIYNKIKVDVIKIEKINLENWKKALKKRKNGIIKNVLQFPN